MSLYHKYRPGKMGEVRGNVEAVESVSKMLENPEKCSRAFLLSGPTGCGKTTMARIIKNTLEVDDVDFREINASDDRGIEKIREIIKNLAFKPLSSKYRIYLLDECHKLTNDAQNALLKVLEDGPKHIFFLLCTTEPEKIIKAVQGRCTMVKLSPLNEKDMKRLLLKVIKAEGDTVEDEVLTQIIEDSQGHPRNALQILEQVLSVEPDNRLQLAKRTAEQTNQSIELCRELISSKGSWKGVTSILEGLKGQDPESIRRVVLGYAQAVLLKSDNPRAALILECFMEPTYNSGFPQIVFSSYQVIKS